MLTLLFYKCLIIIIFFGCIIQVQAVENWESENNFNTGRKLMEIPDGFSIAIIFFMVAAAFTTISICCCICCWIIYKHKKRNGNGCEEEHSLANASTTVTLHRPPVMHQPIQKRSFSNDEDLSFGNAENVAFSSVNRTPQPYSTATLFSKDSSISQTPIDMADAPQVHNSNTTATVYNMPSAPQLPTPLTSIVAEVPPPGYSSVVLEDLIKGEHTQYQKVVRND